MNVAKMLHKTPGPEKTRTWFVLSFLFIISTCLAGCAVYQRIQAAKAPRYATGPAAYKGAESCRSCHEDIYDQWKGSRHADAAGQWFKDAVAAMPYFPTCNRGTLYLIFMLYRRPFDKLKKLINLNSVNSGNMILNSNQKMHRINRCFSSCVSNDGLDLSNIISY